MLWTVAHQTNSLMGFPGGSDGKELTFGNPPTLLVGMQTSTTTMENSVEIPLKIANRTAI